MAKTEPSRSTGAVPFRLTLATVAVLEALLEDPTTATYGLALGDKAGLPSGTIHPILARLEGAGWVTSHWEDIDPREAGRPRRRLYQLTATGASAARDVLRGRARVGQPRVGFASSPIAVTITAASGSAATTP